MKKSIPIIREWEGNEKNPFPQFGNGNQRLSFPKIPGNGNGNEKKHNMTIKEKYLANMWREKACSKTICKKTEQNVLSFQSLTFEHLGSIYLINIIVLRNVEEAEKLEAWYLLQ